jgi:phosphoenolpyruvate carboxylase
MDHSANRSLQQFRNEVGIKFQLYNSLFTSLPFHKIEKTGILLSVFSSDCEEGYRKGQSPSMIIREFFEKQSGYKEEKEKTDLLFRFIQYAERQVVLFDALEDAAFTSVNDMNGPGTLKQLESDIVQFGKEKQLVAKLKEFAVRLVLTAHPTQFYPGPVLGIINDLTKALATNNTSLVNSYLQQLGKTPFFKKQKPTPYDEAINLVWYLENVFYHATGRIVSSLNNQFRAVLYNNHPVFRMGFWPGGDRDGNPYVTAETTLKVADALRSSIIKCYYLDVRKMKRRLTFEGIESILKELETNLYNNIFIPGNKTDLQTSSILDSLHAIKEIINTRHDGLFVHVVENLARRVEVFGLFFASLDIRQVSTVHKSLWESLAGKINFIPADYADMDEN